MSAMKLNRTHRVLIGVVIVGALVIATIGFAGSYTAVRDLAERKGFGDFAPFFPIGIDAGIVVLLSLDLLLTWLRIGFPLLRQTAWLLTAATIAFNGAAAWPDPLGVGMHAVIPLLFVVSVEAARHAVGRIADITADKHMEGVRISRWLLAFPSTFLLWRRMKLWELRSYDEVIRLEQERLVYQARLRARYGRAWRRKAPVESLMPLKLAKYGIPLAETGPAGLEAAGITVPPPTPPGARTARTGVQDAATRPALGQAEQAGAQRVGDPRQLADAPPQTAGTRSAPDAPREAYRTAPQPVAQEPAAYEPVTREPAAQEPEPAPVPEPEPPSPAGQFTEAAATADPQPAPHQEALELPLQSEPEPEPQVTVPVAPGRVRALGHAPNEAPPPEQQPEWQQPTAPSPPQPQPQPEPQPEPVEAELVPIGIPDGVPREEAYYSAYRQFIAEQGARPSARQLSRALNEQLGITNSDGSLLSEPYLRSHLTEFRDRYNAEMGVSN